MNEMLLVYRTNFVRLRGIFKDQVTSVLSQRLLAEGKATPDLENQQHGQVPESFPGMVWLGELLILDM